jgi:hypothetical protein
MSSVTINPAFRIVSLPRELQTQEEILWYITDVVNLGTVKTINISQNTAPNGLIYHSAIVQLESWNDEYLANMLTDNRQMTMNSYYVNERGNTIQFHFNNGKPMMHIKFVFVESENTADVRQIPALDTSNAWSSIYIPVIPVDLQFDAQATDNYDLQTEDGLRRFFETKMALGVVSRVDFVSKSIPDSPATVRSAYVHFDSWSDSATARYVREQIDCTGEFFVKGHYDGHNFVRFRNRRFMVLKVNRSPIPEANPEANVHQIAARNVELEEKVKTLEEQVADLEAKLIMLETMNEMLKDRASNSQVEAACLWEQLADDQEGPMSLSELM